jgi:uncharacterized membrane protein
MEATAMSTLIAVAYPDARTAGQVRDELIRAAEERLIVLEDAVVVEHQPDGKVKLHQVTHPSRAAAGRGALWGGFIGLLFLVPLFGIAMGATAGAVAGKLTDDGVDDDFLRQLLTSIPPGGAALVVLGHTPSRDKVIERVRPFGGTLLQTSLSADDEEHLRHALGEPAGTA